MISVIVNPLAPVFEWFIAFTLSLPAPIMKFVYCYITVVAILGVVMALWRAKH